jgi:hypothetical protein
VLSILLAIALTSTSPASQCEQDTPLRVRLMVDPDWRAAAPTIRAIVDDTWQSAGLRIEWVEAGADADLSIAVVHQLKARDGVFGGLMFHRDEPTPLAGVSIDAVRDWVDAYRMRLLRVSNSTARGDDFALVARGLGYAAAHEMGHFVLDTRSHASSGVMRATFRDGDLQPRSSRVMLDARNRERLRQQLISSSLRCRCDEDRSAR